MTNETIEIRSYSNNGSNWEWNGDGWDAARFSTDGDFSAYGEGERIKLAAFDSDDNMIEECEGVVRGGKFTLA